MQDPAASSGNSSSGSKKTKQSTIEQAMSIANRQLADEKVCMFIYGEGIPMNKIRSPFFIELCLAVSAAGPGYKPPSYDAARTSQLFKAKVNINEKMSVFDERTKLKQSSMPDGLAKTLSPSELLDVISYLRTLK